MKKSKICKSAILKKIFLILLFIFTLNFSVFADNSNQLKFYYVIRNKLSYGPVDYSKIIELYNHGLVFSNDILEDIVTLEKSYVRDILKQKTKSDISDKTFASKNKFKNEISLGLSRRLKTDIKDNVFFNSDDYKYSAVDFCFERSLNSVLSSVVSLSLTEEKNNASASDASLGARYNLNLSDKLILYFGVNAGAGIIKAFDKSEISGLLSAGCGIKYYFSNRYFISVNNSYKHFTQYYKYNDCSDRLKFGGWFAAFNFGCGF